jgi:serine/threonine protein kinase
VQVLSARRTNLRRQLRTDDDGFLGFVAALLAVDPAQRPSAQQALEHPWLRPAAALPLSPYALPSATQ